MGTDASRTPWTCLNSDQRDTGSSDDDMFATFNMGVGMVLVVPPSEAEEVVERAADANVQSFVVGRVGGGTGLSLR